MVRKHRKQRPQQLGLTAGPIEGAQVVERDSGYRGFRLRTKLGYQRLDFSQRQDLLSIRRSGTLNCGFG
jgi:hypothetical protein